MKKIIIVLIFSLLTVTTLGAQQYNPFILYTLVGGVPTPVLGAGNVLPGSQPPGFLCYGLNAQNEPAPCVFGSGTFNALTGDATSTANGGATEVIGLLNHALPSLSVGYLNWTGSAWALTAVSGGNPCTTTASSIQYDNSGAFGCVADLTYVVHTMTVGTAGIFTFTGSGVINANELNGGTVPASALMLGTNGSNQPIAQTIGANTTVANVTGSTAVPTAASIPAGIQFYTSGTGYSAASSANILGVCTTCVTSAASLTSTAFMAGGGSQASATPSATSTLDSSGDASFAGTLAATGHVTFEGVTSTGATGTAKLVFSASPALTGTPDASGATQFKLPLASSFTSAANGEIGYDTNALNWHFWANGADRLLPYAPTSGITNNHCVEFSLSGGVLSLADAGGTCTTGGSGDTITSPNSTLAIGGTATNTTLDLEGAAGEIMAGSTPALTYTPTLGVGNSHAGALIVENGSANAATTYGSGATTSNEIDGPTVAPSNGDLLYCTISGVKCQLTDTGYAYNSIPNADLAHAATTVNGQTCTLGSTCAVESATSGQVAISGGSGSALTGAADLTYSTHTFSGTANTIFDLSAATGTAAFKVPQTTTNTATAAGVIDYDTSNSNYHAYNGADSFVAVFPSASPPTSGHLAGFLKTTNTWTLEDLGAFTVGNLGGLGTGVATALGNAANGSGGFWVQPGVAQYDLLTSGGATAAATGTAINGFVYASTSGVPAAGTATQLGTLANIAQYDTIVSGGTSAALGGVAPSATSGIPYVSGGSSANPSFTTAVVAGGGTGDTSFTAYAPVVGGTSTTGALASSVVGTSGQVFVSQGSSTKPTFIDFPDVKEFPAANCVNSVAGSGWSLGASGVVTCRAGTNNTGGYVAITDTSGTFGEFSLTLPYDWDTSSSGYPLLRFELAYPGTDGGSSHTIIPQIKVACTNGTSNTTDDPTFNTAHSASTITLSSATANYYFATSTVTMNSTDLTNCVGGSLMLIQVGRATDTATSAANFYSVSVTIPRLIVVQAN